MEFLFGMAFGIVVTLLLIGWIVVNPSWRHAKFAGASIPWPGILGMRLRGTPAAVIVDAHVALAKRGRKIDWQMVEAIYLANKGRRLDAHALSEVVDRQLADRAQAQA